MIYIIYTSSFCDVFFKNSNLLKFLPIEFNFDEKKKADSVDCLTFGFTMQNILRGVKVRFEASFFPRK